MTRRLLSKTTGLLILGAFCTAGCHEKASVSTGTTATQPAAGFQGVNQAVAVLHAAPNQNVSGTVTFTDVENGVRIVADVRGLEPGSAHGFHIHEYGDCTAPDFTSAGGHYNPENAPHDGPEADEHHHHAGDLGNLEADNQGTAHKELVMHNISLTGRNPILGRSVVLHAGRDDLKTSPSGNSGPRIACGVIGIANPQK
jgi:Cu-Zn family superoxide dismutase